MPVNHGEGEKVTLLFTQNQERPIPIRDRTLYCHNLYQNYLTMILIPDNHGFGEKSGKINTWTRCAWWRMVILGDKFKQFGVWLATLSSDHGPRFIARPHAIISVSAMLNKIIFGNYSVLSVTPSTLHFLSHYLPLYPCLFSSRFILPLFSLQLTYLTSLTTAPFLGSPTRTLSLSLSRIIYIRCMLMVGVRIQFHFLPIVNLFGTYSLIYNEYCYISLKTCNFSHLKKTISVR